MSKQFAKTSIWITIIMVIGYGISFLKEAVIANYYGVSSDVDAYTIAITIPVTLFALVSVAIQSIVIPLYSNLLYNKGQAEASAYINNLITVTGLFTLLFIVICEVLAGPLTSLFAPGFSEDTHAKAVLLLRICMPTVFFSVLEKIYIGLLNVHKKFILPSFAVYLLNVGIITSIILLHEQIGISAACIGQVVGSILQALFLVFLARKIYSFKYTFSIKNDLMKKTAGQSLPVFWSISIAELCAVINRVVASFLFVGSIAALGYASKMNGVMMTFFTAAISTIVYPLYAESAAKKSMSQLNSRINFTLSVYSFFLIPLMCGILCYKRELIMLAFGRGAFDESAIDVTQSLFGFYSFGLLFMAFRDTLTKVFYSLQDTKTPAKNATIGVIFNILLNLSLPFFLGVNGLAIATSLTSILITTLLLKDLRKKHSEMSFKCLFKNMIPTIIAALLMTLMLMIAKHFIPITNLWIVLGVGGGIGVITYFVAGVLLRNPIISEMKSMLINK